MKLQIYVFLLLGTSLASNCYCQKLEDALAFGMEHNPELKAVELRYQAALEKVPQVGTLPDPVVSVGGYVLPVETRLGPQYARVSLSQQFPWFGTLEAKRSVAAQEAEEAYQQFLLKKNAYAFSVKKVWYRVVRVKAISHLHIKQIKILRSLEQLALSRVKGGKGKLADVLRIQMKIIQQESGHKEMTEKEETWKKTLNLRIWASPEAGVAAPDSFYSLKVIDHALSKSALRQNPIFKKLEAEKATAVARGALVDKINKPTIGVGLNYGFVGPRRDVNIPHEGRDILMPTVSISLPIYRKKYTAMRSEQSLLLEANSKQIEFEQFKLMDELITANQEFKDAIRDQELYASLIEKAQSIYNLLLTAYAQDESNIQDLLDIRDDILAYRKQAVDASFSGHIALSKIEKITGQ